MRATGSHVAAFVQVQLLKERPARPLIGLTLGLVILFSVQGSSKACSRVVFDLLWQKVCLILHSATILDQGVFEVLFDTESSCIVVKTPAQWKALLSYLHCVHSGLHTALIIGFARHLCLMLLSAWWFSLVVIWVEPKETSCSQSFTHFNSSSSSPHQCDWPNTRLAR